MALTAGAVSYATESLVVEVDGAPLAPDLSARLLAAAVDDCTAQPGAFSLSFRDPFHDAAGKGRFAFGARVTIALADGTVLLSQAEVTARDSEVDSAGTITVVRGFDLSHRLHRGRSTEIYRQVRYSDVARTVARRASLETGRVDTPPTSVKPQVTQCNTSDWDFLTSLAREIGYEVAVVDGRLTFAPRPEASSPSVTVTPDDLVRLRCVVSAGEQAAQVEVRGWNPRLKQEVVATAAVAARGSELEEAPATAASKVGGATLTSVAGLHHDTRDATAAAGALAEQVGDAYGTLEGVAHGDPALRAGTVVSLAGAGTGFDGDYTLTATRHVFDEDGYTTWFASGPPDRHSLLGANGPSRTEDPVSGVVPGIVTDARDPEKLGRVKVSFPWLSSANESHWARVAQPWAGNGFGAVFVPEVNDEVLVAFEQGDFGRPYVVGGLYNGRDVPNTGSVPLVDEASGTINVRRMETRKHHSVDLVDKFGSEGIFVRTGDSKLAVELDVAATRITVTSQGDVTISGAKGVNVTSPTGAIALDGNKVSIQGNEVAVEARMALTLKAGLATVIQGRPVKIN